MTKPRALVVALGPLPPPVHGAARVNELVCTALRKRGVRVSVANTAPDQPRGHWTYHVQRIQSHLRAMGMLVAGLRYRRRSLYVTAAGANGIFYQVPTVAIARALRYNVVIHHHSFNYLGDRRTVPARWLMQSAGLRATHVALCAKMADRLSELYPRLGGVVIVGNYGILAASGPAGEENTGLRTARVIGHLSNLSVDKGLKEVASVFDELAAADSELRLVVGGPVSGVHEREILAGIERRWPGRVTVSGAVEPAEVPAWLAQVDVFVFPTRYRHEAAPLVVAEALLAGARVVATDVGCIAEMVGANGAVCDISHFADTVRAQLDLPRRTDADLEVGRAAGELDVERLAGLIERGHGNG